jgi:hypothetical protein
MARPIILILCDYFPPGYMAGGAPRTVANLVERLGDEFLFRVVTRDRDLGESEPYGDCSIGTWTRRGHAEVLYLPPAGLTPKSLRNIISRTDHDALYLCSFFHPRFNVAPLVLRWLHLIPRRPVILAPHGEFSSEALRLKSEEAPIPAGCIKNRAPPRPSLACVHDEGS